QRQPVWRGGKTVPALLGSIASDAMGFWVTRIPFPWLTEKLSDGRNNGLLFVFAQFRKDGQGQHFAGGPFGLREIALAIAEAAECRLHVERNGVVDLRTDAVPGQEGAQRITYWCHTCVLPSTSWGRTMPLAG